MDIVERLRAYRMGGNFGYGYEVPLVTEAAAEIERLRVELEARDEVVSQALSGTPLRMAATL